MGNFNDNMTEIFRYTKAFSESGTTENAATLSENMAALGENVEAIGELEENLNAFQKWAMGLPEKLMNFGVKFVIAILILFIGGKLISLVRKILKKSLQRANAEAGVIQFLDSLAKSVLYILLAVWIASYFGIETASLIAVLGSAGVAVALALQGSLSNFTGGILILVLKPFRVGDYIIEDNKGNEGVVTEIQLFYTKLRTVDDKIVILPNGTLANTSLTNLNLSPHRRIIMNVGISYTSDVKLAKDIIRRLIDAEKRILHDEPVDIFLDSLDSSQVTIGFRFFCKNEDYWDIKWEMNEKVKEALDAAGVEIPYQQLDVHMKE